MRVVLLLLCIFFVGPGARTQQPKTVQESATADGAKTLPTTTALPDTATLLHEVEANEKAFEEAARDFTYKVHTVNTQLNSNGSVKKTTVTDADSFTIDGVRVNKVFARDGKPLSPADAKKEDESVDKEVAKAKAERARLEDNGTPTDPNGNQELTVSRILELGKFSNLRAGEFGDRPAWIVDYAGDPAAKTHNEFEGVVRDLVGTVWIDQADHALMAGNGEFRADFKIGFGLLVDLHKGTSFDFRFTKVDGKAWLPSTIDGSGSLRYLLFGGFNGRIHLQMSDYKRFRTGMTLLPGAKIVPEDSGAKDSTAAGGEPVKASGPANPQ